LVLWLFSQLGLKSNHIQCNEIYFGLNWIGFQFSGNKKLHNLCKWKLLRGNLLNTHNLDGITCQCQYIREYIIHKFVCLKKMNTNFICLYISYKLTIEERYWLNKIYLFFTNKQVLSKLWIIPHIWPTWCSKQLWSSGVYPSRIY
jgi:hypothetical protein